jgi:hypothetical protein
VTGVVEDVVVDVLGTVTAGFATVSRIVGCETGEGPALLTALTVMRYFVPGTSLRKT